MRRSPAKEASFLPAAPRLACVKPVASVHPEPGSNSTLYNLMSQHKIHDLMSFVSVTERACLVYPVVIEWVKVAPFQLFIDGSF